LRKKGAKVEKPEVRGAERTKLLPPREALS